MRIKQAKKSRNEQDEIEIKNILQQEKYKKMNTFEKSEMSRKLKKEIVAKRMKLKNSFNNEFKIESVVTTPLQIPSA